MKEEVSETKFVPSKVNIDSLIHCAIYLSGLKDGKGNLLPLGTIVLDDLWHAISYLKGDVRYIAERDIKK